MRKFLAMALAILMLVSALPMSVLAAMVDYDSSTNACDCYSVISKDDYAIAPGINESEIVLNFNDGSRRQVLHIMEADTTNEYVSVINSYNGMYPEYGNYKTGTMTEQAAWVENNMGLNVVGAMNTTLSWYNTATYDDAKGGDSKRIGEPLGFMMLDAEILFDPANCGYTYGNVGFPSVLVINKDYDDEGNARPADIPKVEMPQIKSAADLDGWEDQVIPVSSGYIVKDGVSQYTQENHLTDTSNSASRSVVGIKPDGTIVIMMNDGRQSPYSAGMSMYECAEVMISLGCSYAVNCDGGGSSTFLSERPGEDLKINCSPSDGAERPTTTGILFISTAPADGEFARANITSDATYYTPGSTVEFDVLGTDLVGNAAEVPEDAVWQLKDESMGTISDGVFISNGKVGTATAQMVYNGEVVGECAVEIVVPTGFSFAQSIMTVPFDKKISLGLKATVNNGLHEVVLKGSDVTITTTNEALGVFDGLDFTSVKETDAPADLTSTVTATLNVANLTATTSLSLGKGSEILYDFEDASQVLDWNIADVNGNDKGFYQNLSHATGDDGKVHNDNGSLRVEFNGVSAPGISAGGYAQSDLYLNDAIIVENAKSIGFWAYIPDEYVHCWIRVLYWYDKNNDGIYESKNTVTVINQPEIYNTASEDGWYYFSVDVSAYKSVMLAGANDKDKIGYNASKCDANNFRFVEFMFPHTNTMDQWKTYGTLNGPYTLYVDNITADFSDAVEDREAPIFSKVTLMGANDTNIALEHRKTAETTNNVLTVSATVAENTKKSNATGIDASSAKAYIDGVAVDADFANGKITINKIAVSDGVHRVKFEVCDMQGNKAVVIRNINVKSGVSTSGVSVVPHDATLDRLYGGSVYWMDINATNIETIQKVSTVIDINSLNHWELDHMELAAGFAAEYTVDQETNTATITITRTGINNQTGAATIASLPIRVVYYDNDIKVEGYDAASFWVDYNFWPQDLKVDVDMGEITYVADYTSSVLNTFSNDQFCVDTEMYTSSQHMDSAFKTERGTAHVHTPVAIDDVNATCAKSGYKNRTYCEVCDSVVDWGTAISAAGHNFAVVDGIYQCTECGDKSEVTTGLVKDGDVYRYIINSVPQSGWIMIDTDWYYFHPDTMAAKAGACEINSITFEFEETGKLVSGVWAETLLGTKYYYGPSCYGAGWYEIDGKDYFFENTYRYEGYRMVFKAKTRRWYNFGTDGACQEGTIPDGFYNDGNKGLGYVVNGIGVEGLHKIDGDYYFFNYYGYAQKGYASVGKTECDLPLGKYYFGDDYKAYNGLLEVDGTTFYYENGKAKAAGLVEIDGDYYFAGGANGEITTNKKTYVWKGNGLLPEGEYVFDKEGKLADGIVELDGVLYYCAKGQPKVAGLVKIGDDYYFAGGSNGEIIVNKTQYAWKTNDLLPADNYEFGADGKMLQGIVEKEGTLYYYNNGKPKQAGLVEIDGAYYFAGGANGEITVSKVQYVWKNQIGVQLETGECEFGADGKMLDGIVEKEGVLYYYIMGRPKQAGLIEVDGGYYFAGGPNGELTVNKVQYVWKNQIGVQLETGECEFGADGKMLDGIVEKDGVLYYYIMGRPKQAGLIEVDGDYYFASGPNGELTVNKVQYVWKNEIGVQLETGECEFGADGKMLNGVVEKDGALYYYVMGRPKQAGLIEVDGDYYFAGGANGEISVNTTQYVWKSNGLLPEGDYHIGADGKFLDGFVTRDDGIYYYVDGKYGKVGLNYIDGEYYFVNYGGRLFTSGTYYVWATNGLSICMNYTFDDLGRVVR